MGSLRVYCMEHRTAAAYEEHCVFAGFADRIFRGALASWGRLGAVLGHIGGRCLGAYWGPSSAGLGAVLELSWIRLGPY